MRLPKVERQITSADSALLPNPNGRSLVITKSRKHINLNLLFVSQTDDTIYSLKEATRFGPAYSKLREMQGNGTYRIAHAPAVSRTGNSNTNDPLDLIIAKRKKKELADPVIAEAILTASKLPPPRIPEARDDATVPEEIQQLISFGHDTEKDNEENVAFFRHYPLFINQHPVSSHVKRTPSLTRYGKFKRKWFFGRFQADKFREVVNSKPPAETRQDLLVQPEVHSDEDWFMESCLHIVCIMLIVLTLPISLIFCLKVVAHYERAVLFRLGRLVSATAQGPGLIIVLPCLDRYRILDLRTFTFDVPTQEVLTKDSVTVVVNAVVYYRVRDPVRAVVNVEDANRATRVLGQTTLRNVLGTVNLDQLLTAREDIAALMQECLDSVTEAWGVKVERVEIKDVRLPIQLQRAMAAEAESVREATAKVIAAEGEKQASGALKAAAFEIKQHPIAMQLRYLQAMNSISSGKESTIIFPVPLELVSFLQSPFACHNYLTKDFNENKQSENTKTTDDEREQKIRSHTTFQSAVSEEFFLNEGMDSSALIV
ncbi:unnamed protein product [Dicrocoelium dendriticum]|nr:unnamed protein product [Dicrocoelium dendriticum]